MEQYKILQSFTGFTSLEEQVNSHIKSGWTPLGGAGFSGGWFQAITK